MSSERLHDLLSELVDDVAPAGSWETAWRSAERTRRRRRYAALAGATAVVLAVAGGASLLDRDQATPVISKRPTPTPSPAVNDFPDAREGPTRIWNSPLLAEEANLPWFEGSPLPRSIDLSAGAPAVGPDPALAVFALVGVEEGQLRRVVVLTDAGESSLDVGHLKPTTDEQGNGISVLGDVSPDGRHVFFVQRSSLEVYEFATGEWTSIDTPDWLAEGARWLENGRRIGVPRKLGGMAYDLFDVFGKRHGAERVSRQGGDYTYGPLRESVGGTEAQSRTRPDREAEGILVAGNVLAFVPREARSKGCCPVVDWLDEDTVAYESGGRVLAWRVGSHDVRRVAEIVGSEQGVEAYAVSWATLHP